MADPREDPLASSHLNSGLRIPDRRSTKGEELPGVKKGFIHDYTRKTLTYLIALAGRAPEKIFSSFFHSRPSGVKPVYAPSLAYAFQGLVATPVSNLPTSFGQEKPPLKEFETSLRRVNVDNIRLSTAIRKTSSEQRPELTARSMRRTLRNGIKARRTHSSLTCLSASTIKRIPRHLNRSFQQFDTRASVADRSWQIPS
ncbi:18Spre-rib s in 255 species: Archae - 22 [Striga asiatica]|uniref:18Spre-rib s in 255 species: Archae-22 n=1 Tax=Striga asiatica TaxID=4170 RepID=A0A5A7Q0A8_STRAF|nr:18Spre-rib s in 255 species: Archae - 22 [Striga asiatica]